MKVSADRKWLAEAMRWVARACSKSDANTAGMSIETGKGQLALSASSYDVRLSARVVAQVDDPGAAVVPGLVTAGFAHTARAESVELAAGDHHLDLTAGRSSARIQVMHTSLYDWPDREFTQLGAVPAVELQAAITSVAEHTMRDVKKIGDQYWMGAVLLFATDGRLTLICGSRYSIGRVQLQQAWEAATLVAVPALALVDAMTGLDGEIEISASPQGVRLATEDRTAILRVIDTAKIPPVNRLFEQQPPAKLTVATDELLTAAKLALTGSDRVRLDIDVDTIKVSTFQPETGEVSHEVSDYVTCTAETPSLICVRGAMLLAALNHSGPELTMTYYPGVVKAVKITDGDTEHIIQPVHHNLTRRDRYT